MNKVIFIGLIFITLKVSAQSIEEISMSELNKVLNSTPRKTLVINFWASWCGPCVKELPYFNKVHSSQIADIKLISLDFPEENQKAANILAKRNITAPAYLLNTKDYIEQIDESWSGAIPATLIIDNQGRKHFYEKSFNEAELINIIETINNQ